VTEQQLTAWMDAYAVAFEEQDAGDRLCTSFREWWNTREEPLGR
jgi:hypothetical protein